MRQLFPLAHLAPIFTQPMGASSTHNDTAGSSREPIVISDTPSSAKFSCQMLWAGGYTLAMVHFFEKKNFPPKWGVGADF